jgi:hypothetical protein
MWNRPSIPVAGTPAAGVCEQLYQSESFLIFIRKNILSTEISILYYYDYFL